MVMHRYLKDVATLQLDEEKCIGCGLCVEVCPHRVLKMADGKASIIDKDACMECGACSINCCVDAITDESGVGCASAIFKSFFTGEEPTCDCNSSSGKSCC